MANPKLANQITVYGAGLGGPLLKTQDARLIQIHDGMGELSALVVKLTDALWGISVKGEPDWEEHKHHLYIPETPDSCK